MKGRHLTNLTNVIFFLDNLYFKAQFSNISEVTGFFFTKIIVIVGPSFRNKLKANVTNIPSAVAPSKTQNE